MIFRMNQNISASNCPIMLRYECGENPYEMRRKAIMQFIDVHTAAYVGLERKGESKAMAAEIMSKGMKCLMEQLGVVEAERFVATVIRERFDYIRWQRDHFSEKTPEEISQEAEAFELEDPYLGNAVRL